MHSESFDSVRIIWLDQEAVFEQLRQAVKKLADEFQEIEQIVLFGSLARGDAVPGSDADLLIILSESDLQFLGRIPRYTPSYCGIGVEVFPYTSAEAQKMLTENNHLIKRALAEGIELFRRKKDGSNRV